jgi:hypothetical protein
MMPNYGLRLPGKELHFVQLRSKSSNYSIVL